MKHYADRACPLLDSLRTSWEQSRPLDGVRILHNIPVTLETLVKLQSLLAGGAHVTVTACRIPGLSAQPVAVEGMAYAGIPFVARHQDIHGEFDIALDCGCQVPDMANVHITEGAVELTQTGGRRYRELNLAYPAIDVDNSDVKKFEGLFGTGDAFMRAFKKLQPDSDLRDKRFVVFGYGKVGRGIVAQLMPETRLITVVESNSHLIPKIKQQGLHALKSDEIDAIKRAAGQAYAIVTASGVQHLLSRILDPRDCPQALLANMGANDEIGPKFEGEQVLCNKMPINFSLAHPTLMRFIDPVFYAHNLAAWLILTENYPAGYRALSREIDHEIIALWQRHHQDDVSAILD